MAIRSLGPPTTMSFRLAIGHWLRQSSLQKEGEPDVKLNGELHHDHRPSLGCDELEAMLIYSMSVSVDGFIADRAGAFGWSVPNEEQFRFHLAQTRELGGFLCGRRLYETMLGWRPIPRCATPSSRPRSPTSGAPSRRSSSAARSTAFRATPGSPRRRWPRRPPRRSPRPTGTSRSAAPA